MRQRNGFDRSLAVLTAAILIWATQGLAGTHTATAQTPPERRLAEDHVLVEQIPGAVRRAVAARKPAPEVVAEIEGLVDEAFQFYTAGRTGETRRLLYRALALAIDREWTPRDEYWRSLILRSNKAVCDPARPIVIRLEQNYRSTYELESTLTLRAFLLKPGRSEKSPPVKELGNFEGVAIDLIDQPFSFTADLSGVEDGYYDVAVDVFEKETLLRRVKTPVYLLTGMDAARDDVERRLKAVSGHESAKASVRYPFDFALQVNLGKVWARGYDFKAEIKEAQELLAKLEKGEDPLYGAVGGHKRHYWFEEAGEIMPYRIDVPESYDGTRGFPMMIALHGNGGTEDTMATVGGGVLIKEANKLGYIVVCPLGYRRNGGYGAEGNMGRPYGPVRRHITQLSEKDVMNVLELVRSEYRIDENRIYLMGGSMGGGGTWRIGAKYPDIWAAIGPLCPGVMPDEIDLEGMKHIPVIVTHGDADTTVPVQASRAMVAAMKELGMTYEYIEVPGGGHMILNKGLKPTLQFFEKHRRNPG